MKGLFPEFDASSEKDFGGIWNRAIFVFDTNVLLNLYRYQSSTRDQLLEVLEKLSDRIWIPHHVALEFQRNRVKVIADQSNRFHDVRRTVTSSAEGLRNELGKLQLSQRHSLIDADPLISGFEELAKNFLNDLDEVQKRQQSLTDPDPLKEKIENLFDGRVGDAPKDQKEVDDLYRKAEKRYASSIPPGFMDQSKDKASSDEYLHRGINYKRKFGDYLVWCQILDYAKSANASAIVFVTDDGKDDWWWVVKSGAPKTLGPRPELIDEAAKIAGISEFLMYKPSSFLEFADKFLSAGVTEATLEEVRDISEVRSLRNSSYEDMRRMSHLAERSVFNWLSDKFSIVNVNQRAFPDFVAIYKDKRFGFEVKTFSSARAVLMRVRDLAYRAHFHVAEGDLDMVTLVLVAPSFSEAEAAVELLERRPVDTMPETVRVLVGAIEEGDDGFVPIKDISLGKAANLFEGHDGQLLFRGLGRDI